MSEGIESRVDGARVIVMAVPTSDARGRVTGVLAAALHAPAVRDHEGLARPRRRRASSSSTATAARSWAARPTRATPPRRAPCAARASSPIRAGSTARTSHALAYTTSAIPGWTIVIDQPRAVLFADARRGLFLELALVRRGGVDRALPDRVHPAARPPRRRARAHAGAAAPRSQPHPRQRVARQRGLERPRRPGSPMRSRSALRRRAGRRGSPRARALARPPRGAFPLERGRARRSSSRRRRRSPSTPARRS